MRENRELGNEGVLEGETVWTVGVVRVGVSPVGVTEVVCPV